MRVSEPLAQRAVDSPGLARLGGEEDEEQEDKRDGIEFGAEVAPQRNSVASRPPGG